MITFKMKPGQKLRELAIKGNPVQVAGVINAYTAMLATKSGIKALYLSGGATAASLGMPDLGVLTYRDMADLAFQITRASKIPLLVDADTGYGGELLIERAVRAIEEAGACGIHLEDQVSVKRCGHRSGKALCSPQEMVARIHAACEAKEDKSFVIMARTDAIGVEGLESAIERSKAYVKAGADMVFVEGVTEAGQLGQATAALEVPVLANMTEFGVSPLLGLDELAKQNVALALYPLTAFRVMMKSAESTYQELVKEGSQKSLVGSMQTREELYENLDYHRYEKKADQQIKKNSGEVKNG